MTDRAQFINPSIQLDQQQARPCTTPSFQTLSGSSKPALSQPLHPTPQQAVPAKLDTQPCIQPAPVLQQQQQQHAGEINASSACSHSDSMHIASRPPLPGLDQLVKQPLPQQEPQPSSQQEPHPFHRQQHHQPLQPRSSPTNPPPVTLISTAPSTMQLPSAAQRRQASQLAAMLLSLATCHGCSRTVQDPVTLPCGHSTCMQCIKHRTVPRTVPAEQDIPTLPCLSHLPPRLPLSPMTVPCPVSACPRSAIGKGLGVWAGHRPRYGIAPTYTERLPIGDQDVGHGALPADGFVVGVSDHPYQLTVIGPQLRSKTHLFSIPPGGVEPTGSTSVGSDMLSLLPSLALNDMLRPDVTLSKAVAVLRRYTSSPLLHASRSRRGGGLALSPLSATSRGSHRIRTPHQVGPASLGEDIDRPLRRIATRCRSFTGSASSQSSSSMSSHQPSLENISSEQHHKTSPDRRIQASGSVMNFFSVDDCKLQIGTVGGGIRPSMESDDGDGDQYTSENEDVDREEVDHGTITDQSDDGQERENQDIETEYKRSWPSDGPDGVTSCDSHDNSRRCKRPKLTHFSAQPTTVKDGSRSVTTSPMNRIPQNQGSSSSARSHRLGEHDHDLSDTDAMIDKHNSTLSSKAGVKALQPPFQTVATLHSKLLEVLECQLCFLLLYEPLTTPCGHTFCKSCFARSLDHGNKCPLCRSELPKFVFFQHHPLNSTLIKILTSNTASLRDDVTADHLDLAHETSILLPPILNPTTDSSSSAALNSTRVPIAGQDAECGPHHVGFQRLYQNRKAAIEQEEEEARLATPIFVCTLAFPGMPTLLHIFEPRYRLMIRRCLESGNPRFGMILPLKNSQDTQEYGTMLEIQSVQFLQDGRILLKTIGSFRFRLVEKRFLDGYMVGRIEKIEDISLQEEVELERTDILKTQQQQQYQTVSSKLVSFDNSQEEPLYQLYNIPQQVIQPPTLSSSLSTIELIETCLSFIQTIESTSSWLLDRLYHTYGPMPKPRHQIEKLGYWMALIIPIDEYEKAKLLPITSPRLRLCLVVDWITQLRQSGWFKTGCIVS